MMKTWRWHLLLTALLCASCNSSTDHDVWYATLQGDTNTLRRYVTNGGDINRQIRYKLFRTNTCTPLHIAVESCNPATIQYLLDNGADPNRLNDWGSTPLSLAIGRPCTEAIKLLLQHGADPNKPESSRYGFTPLHRAVSLNNVEAVKMLLAAGAQVNATNKSDNTPLHFAEDRTVAELLLIAGANPAARNDMQKTPADMALAERRYDILVVITNAAAWTNSVRQLNSTRQP